MIVGCTLSFRSLINATSSRALSTGIPAWIETLWRTVEPAAGLGSFHVSDFSGTPRFASFCPRISLMDFRWKSSSAEIETSRSLRVISDLRSFRS